MYMHSSYQPGASDHTHATQLIQMASWQPTYMCTVGLSPVLVPPTILHDETVYTMYHVHVYIGYLDMCAQVHIL